MVSKITERILALQFLILCITVISNPNFVHVSPQLSESRRCHRSKTPKGKAVVSYCEPLATQHFLPPAMLLTDCLTFQSTGRSIEFKTLVIIASAIGLEAAVTGSGLSGKIAGLMALIGGENPHIAITMVFLGCILMDTMVTNVASAAFMFPIAMAMAGNLGVNGMPFVITVMVGASCSFISPMGYQTNLMVYGPGGYKFTDFVKVGVPLTIVVGIIVLTLTPMIWPF